MQGFVISPQILKLVCCLITKWWCSI